MINTLINAISITLNEEFGDEYNTYVESIEQGLEEPCFFVFCLNPTKKLFLGRKYFRSNMFCIQYFPLGTEKNIECNETLERLFNCLEIINVQGDKTRGSRMHGEIADDVLNFFVNYDMFVYRVEEKIIMGDLIKTVIQVGGE